MHVIYADAGLWRETGYRARLCRLVGAAMRSAGHRVSVVASRDIEPGLAADVQARAHLRLRPDHASDADPVCGWLSGFFADARVAAEDWLGLGPFDPDDLLFVPAATPAQLLGLRILLLNLPAPRRPHVLAELSRDPGLDFVDAAPAGGGPGGGHFAPRDSRTDPRAALYRFAGQQINAVSLPHLQLCSFDRSCAEVYALLLGRPVQTLPVPFSAGAPRAARPGPRPRSIGVLADGIDGECVDHLPQIADALLEFATKIGAPNIRLLVQGATSAGLRSLAARDARLVLDPGPAGPQHRHALLDQCDLILCPADPQLFRAAFAPIVCEAIAHGIPLVVPARTTLSRRLEDFGGPGIGFAEPTPAAVAASVHAALRQLDDLTGLAAAAAARWHATMGAARMVDAICAPLLAVDRPAGPPPPAAPAMPMVPLPLSDLAAVHRPAATATTTAAAAG